MDVFIDVPRVPYEKLGAAVRGEPSAAIMARVAEARTVQHRRFATEAGFSARLNSDMSPPEVRDHAQGKLEPAAAELLNAAAKRLILSARSFHRVLKLSRTISDLGASDPILVAHVAEALQYREREG